MKQIFKKPLGAVRNFRMFGLFIAFATMSLNAQNTGTIQIGSGTTNSSYSNGSIIPINYYGYIYSQQLVKVSEYAAGGGAAGDITKIRWMLPNIGGATDVYGDWDIWIGHTTKTAFASNTDWIPISDMQQVFSGNIHTAGTPGPTNNTWFEINFSTPFTYNGTDNIVVAVHEKTPGYTSDGMTVRTYASTSNSGIVYRSDGTNPNPASPPEANDRPSVLAQIQFEGTLASCMPVTAITTANLTPTSIDISWTAGNTETIWDIQWGTEDFNPNTNTGTATGSQSGLTSPNYSITGLTHNTTYKVYVRADCGSGDTSFWLNIDLLTPQIPVSIPYTDDFSSNDWILGNGTQTNQWHIGSATGNPADALYISDDGGTSNAYNITSASVVHARKNVTFPAGTKTFNLQFNWKGMGEGSTFSYDYMRVWLIPETAIPTPGTQISTTNTPGAIQLGANFLNKTDWQTENFVIPNSVAGSNRQVVFEWRNDTSTGTQPPAAVDNVSISIIDCSYPIDLTFTQNSMTGATLGWTSDGNLFDVEWGEAGFTLGSGTQINGLTTNSVDVITIMSTYYQFYVRQDCGSTDGVSIWSGPFNFKTGHCTPSFGTSSLGYIKKFVTTGGIIDINNETNAQSTGGYGDFYNLSVVAIPGTSIGFTATFETAIGSGFAIWIDWNKNGVFEANERVFNTTSVQTTATGNISIPADALGTYRIRILADYNDPNPNDPCIITTSGGEVEDYTLDVSPLTDCSGTPDAGTITVTPNESFNGGTHNVKSVGYTYGNGLTYTWESNTNEAGWVEESTSSSYQNLQKTTVGVLGDQIQYRLKVSCDVGGTAFSNIETLTIVYCTTTTTNPGDYTEHFHTSNALTNANYNATSQTGTQGYNNLSNDPLQLITQIVGQPIEFSHLYHGGAHHIRIWVDLNKNGTFEDSEEVFYKWISNNGPIEESFTIPMSTTPDNYLMRMRSQYKFTNPNSSLGLTPCGNLDYGQTLDFTLAVIDPPTCMPVSLPITATNSSATSVLLEWVSDGNLFDIEYGTQGFTQGSGTTITEVSNPYILQGLTAGTQYQYYVRQNCGNGDESIWRGPVSFIPGNFDGKISSRLHTEPQVTSLACGSTFAIDVPAGKQIASLKVDYTMTSASPRWMSEQRSVLYSPTLNAGEPDVISGPSANDFPGVQDYSRSVNFANGATGTVEFELKAWRIAGNQGCTDNEIFVEPGTWILTPTFEDIPACPNPPTDLGYNVISESSVELFWTAGTSGATHQLKYGNVGFDVNTAGTSEDNLTANMLTLTGLDSSIQYEFYVRRDCGAGDFGTWVGPFKFNSGYCIPTSDITYHFTAFNTTNAIQNASYSGTGGGTGYVNNTNEVDLVIEQEHGQSFDFSSNYIGGASGLRIWVDWNKNFVFDDSEQVFYSADANGNKSGTITIPLNTLTGDYRMRVRAEQGSSSNPSACGEIAMGEALDFTLKVNGAVSVANFDLYEFRYHPNPVNDILHFSSNSRIESVTISNILGQQISANLNSDNTILDMSNLPSGNYFVKVTIEGVSKTIKVIKN